MYGKERIIPGIIIFLGLMTFPLWYNAGNARHLPKPEKPAGYRECVEPTQRMRTSHMQIIDHWRDDILREGGSRTGRTASGQTYDRSLQNGCMKCHASMKKFCDECHNYTAVKPYCWDCHLHAEASILKEAM